MISWSLDTLYFHHIHSKIQSEITCTHNYPQFSPSWCPSVAGSSSPPPPWSPPWQSPPCPALSLPSTPSSSQPWCSQQAPNPQNVKLLLWGQPVFTYLPLFCWPFAVLLHLSNMILVISAQKQVFTSQHQNFSTKNLRSTFVPTRMIGVVSGACCLFWKKRYTDFYWKLVFFW